MSCQLSGTRDIGDVVGSMLAAIAVVVRCRCGIGPPTSPRPSPPLGAEREFAPALVRMCESNSLSALGGGEGQGEVGASSSARSTTCSTPSMFSITSLFQKRMTR